MQFRSLRQHTNLLRFAHHDFSHKKRRTVGRVRRGFILFSVFKAQKDPDNRLRSSRSLIPELKADLFRLRLVRLHDRLLFMIVSYVSAADGATHHGRTSRNARHDMWGLKRDTILYNVRPKWVRVYCLRTTLKALGRLLSYRAWNEHITLVAGAVMARPEHLPQPVHPDECPVLLVVIAAGIDDNHHQPPMLYSTSRTETKARRTRTPSVAAKTQANAPIEGEHAGQEHSRRRLFRR